ncbi:uracil-DNA glycosylase family protein [Hyphomicrobiales bacterium 4NK60-0047b]
MPLPHEPRPVLQVSETVKIAICGQAPGTKVHLSGRPFTDASGDRLREWLGVDNTTFYNDEKLAIVPMGFCFPGQTAKGADLPPRRECAAHWHARLFPLLKQLDLVLLVGKYAIAYHLKSHESLSEFAKQPLYEVVKNYKSFFTSKSSPLYLPLPHPSWRNNHWLKKNLWFEDEYLPLLREEVLKRL